jgi:uncharacterized protein (DUF2164 family)
MRDDANKIKLTKEKRSDMIEALKAYYLKEKEEKLGDLAAGLLLDFITEDMGPEYYNQGVLDSCKFMQDKAEDLLSIQKFSRIASR